MDIKHKSSTKVHFDPKWTKVQKFTLNSKWTQILFGRKMQKNHFHQK